MIYPRSAWQTRDIFIQLEHRFFYSMMNINNSDWLISPSQSILSILITQIKTRLRISNTVAYSLYDIGHSATGYGYPENIFCEQKCQPIKWVDFQINFRTFRILEFLE